MIATLIWTLAVASVPPVYTTSQLDEGIMCVFALGKLGYGEVFSSFDERRPRILILVNQPGLNQLSFKMTTLNGLIIYQFFRAVRTESK